MFHFFQGSFFFFFLHQPLSSLTLCCTTLNTPTLSPPAQYMSHSHKIHSSLNHITCTTIKTPALPLPPPQTKKKKSIIPLKQCNCKRTTHSSTYLSYGTKSWCTTNINQPANCIRPILFQYCHLRKHNDIAI